MDKKMGGRLLSQIKKGDAMEEIASRYSRYIDEANEMFFDYGNVPEIVQFMRKAPIGSPFISFSYNYANKLLELAKSHPGFINLQMKAQKEASAVWPMSAAEKKSLKNPKLSYLSGSDYMKVLSTPNQSYYLRTGAFNPMAGFNKIGSEGFDWPILQNPLTSIPTALATNKNFLGKEIYSPKDPSMTKILKGLGYVVESIVPSPIPGSYHTKAIINELQQPKPEMAKRVASFLGFSYGNIQKTPPKNTKSKEWYKYITDLVFGSY
jgi:hypothetical protein